MIFRFSMFLALCSEMAPGGAQEIICDAEDLN